MLPVTTALTDYQALRQFTWTPVTIRTSAVRVFTYIAYIWRSLLSCYVYVTCIHKGKGTCVAKEQRILAYQKYSHSVVIYQTNHNKYCRLDLQLTFLAILYSLDLNFEIYLLVINKCRLHKAIRISLHSFPVHLHGILK